MLVPKTRRLLTRLIPAPFYDSTFCVVTCVSLLVLFFAWNQSPVVLWDFGGWQEALIHVLFYCSWAALLYSLALTGLGYQNGWTPFYYWLRRQKAPPREFKPKGAYRWIRHPVYLSFLGLVWFTPRMTLDHAVLTLIWTGYIFYGSLLKDRRLEFFIGRAYVEYQRRVPGYPLMLLGPLGRRRPSSEKAVSREVCSPLPESPSTRTAA
jgi:protein-S-isoprenylcysteine O-methyltransferase Ste14